MIDLTLLVEGPFLPDAIDILWNDAPLRFDPAAQALIDERWNHHLANAHSKNISLFNAPITRLISAQKQNGRLLLTLGPTDYKTFLVTIVRDRPLFAALALEQTAAALGNSVLLTHQGQALLGIRSPRTAAYPGRAHLIGGVLDLLDTPALPADSSESLIVHLKKELLEEAGVTPTDLDGSPTLLAIVRDEVLAQPELIWRWETTIPLATIAQRLAEEEHSGSLLIEKKHITAGILEQMTPVARAAWSRWTQV